MTDPSKQPLEAMPVYYVPVPLPCTSSFLPKEGARKGGPVIGHYRLEDGQPIVCQMPHVAKYEGRKKEVPSQVTTRRISLSIPFHTTKHTVPPHSYNCPTRFAWMVIADWP